MGINAEMIRLVADLRKCNLLCGDRVIDLGAQDVCAASEVIHSILAECQFDNNFQQKESIYASHIYAALGFKHYSSIDANGANGSLTFDLNLDLKRDFQYSETYDLVTNLGTSEHCFNQFMVFKNLHDLCRPGGLMIHALPVQGNVNHGFYNYHPRFIADLAAANNYQVVRLAFTVDYRPTLVEYSLDVFKMWDSHDLLLYAILKKLGDSEFCIPFDGMFASVNKLDGYLESESNPLTTEFSPYLKGGNWSNTLGYEASGTKQHVLTRMLSEFRTRLRKKT